MTKFLGCHYTYEQSDYNVVPWWRPQMETFAALLALCAGNSLVTGEFPQKGQWRGAMVSSLICTWINGWVNNRAHYDVTVMRIDISSQSLHHSRWMLVGTQINRTNRDVEQIRAKWNWKHHSWQPSNHIKWFRFRVTSCACRADMVGYMCYHKALLCKENGDRLIYGITHKWLIIVVKMYDAISLQ